MNKIKAFWEYLKLRKLYWLLKKKHGKEEATKILIESLVKVYLHEEIVKPIIQKEFEKLKTE